MTTSTCDTNDQAKQCNSMRNAINKRTNQCSQLLASKPSHSPPLKLYGRITKTIRGFLNLVDRRRGGTSAHSGDGQESVLGDGEVNPGDSAAGGGSPTEPSDSCHFVFGRRADRTCFFLL